MADKKDAVIPTEVLKMDARSLQMYKDALNEGKEKVYNIRVMVVGQIGVGKSTLIKRLLGYDVDISRRRITGQIYVHRECCKVSLATGEWIRLQNDAEQYSTLQRLVKFLNEHVQEQDSEGKQEGQNEIHDQIALKHLRGDPPHGQSVSAEQDINQKDKTTFSQSVVTPTVNIGPELTVDIGNSENEIKKDVVMEMLQLINKNCDRLEKNFEEYATLSVYDLPGQFAFNTPNYIFLSSHAIYLLVVDLSQELTDFIKDTEGIQLCKVHELIEHFLTDIHSCSPSSESGIPQVILVGTHVDKIPEKYRQKVIDKYFMEIRRMLIDKPIRFHLMYDDFAIDNTICDPKLEDLKKTIVQLASQQPYWGKETPARWLPLEHAINKLKASGVKVVPLSLVEEINRSGSVRIESREEIELFLRFQHDIGTILYFSVEGLRDTIVLDPLWIIDALESLITAEVFIVQHIPYVLSEWAEFKNKRILTPKLIDAIWSRYPDFHDNKDHILLIMERLNIIARPRSFSEVGVKEEHYFIAPFMLQNTTPREIITPKQNLEFNNSSVLTFVFIEKYLPAPIFHRLLAACVAHWPIAKENRKNLIFFNCCVFRIDIDHIWTLHCRDYIIFARVTRMVTNEKAPLAILCAEVRRFLFVQLIKIIRSLGLSLKFELHIQCPKFDADSSEGLIPVSRLQKNDKIVCNSHDRSHKLVSHDLLQFWFDEMDEGDLSLPLEILSMDDNSIKIFKEALKDGEQEVNNIRIMVVGHSGVGKTTLIKRLLEKKVDITDKCSTEGIDVHINCCGVNLETGDWKVEQTDAKDSPLLRLNQILLEKKRKRKVTKETEKQHVRLNQILLERKRKGKVTKETEKQKVSYDADEEQEENDGTQIVQVTKDTEERKENEGRERKENEGTQIVQITKDTEERKENEGRERKENEDPMNVQTQKAEIITGNVEQRTESKQQIIPKNIHSTGSQSSNQNEMLYALGENYHKVQQYTGDYALMSIWDFAGQYAFYTTHQMFLTRRAIYLLVSNVSQELDEIIKDNNDPYFFDCMGKTDCKVHDLVKVWINSIHFCADPKEPGIPPVILVGTHVDEVRKKELEKTSQAQGDSAQSILGQMEGITSKAINEAVNKACEKYFNDFRNYLGEAPAKSHLVEETFAIDNSVKDEKVKNLKKKIIEIASQQTYWREKKPARWLSLEQALMNEKAKGCKVIAYAAVEKLNSNGIVPLKTSEEMDVFLRFLHETGTIIYFSIKVLRDSIILDPVWLIEALKSIINAQSHLPNASDDQSTCPTDSDAGQKWSDFKGKGKLTSELIEALWTEKNYPELHANREHILRIMEHLNIIAKPRAFSEIEDKEENSYLVPCVLDQKPPDDVISRNQDPQMESTPDMSCIFTEGYLPPPIFHRLLAACVARWPVARNKVSLENLLFCGCGVFDIDFHHRLILHFKNHVIYARITRKNIEVRIPLDAKLCSSVRRFITFNLSKITSYLSQNILFDLHASFQTFHADEGVDPDAPITPEYKNHTRLCIALVTVCGNALRDILLSNVPKSHADISEAIMAKESELTSPKKGKYLLNKDQKKLVFSNKQVPVDLDKFDLSLLYILIRNVSTVPAPTNGWDKNLPPSNMTLGDSVERIRSYRNYIIHSRVEEWSKQKFQDWWKKFEVVIQDIEAVTKSKTESNKYSQMLKMQKSKVISIYEAI